MRQTDALAILLSGNNVFLTGEAGSGKTFVLNQFIDEVRNQGINIAVTATTGVAATHINGVTIHSWSGIGIKEQLSGPDLKKLQSNKATVEKMNEADILIIDEISMLDGNRFDMVNLITKMLRQSDKPFGGLQLVVAGDLFQLPPVRRDSSLPFVFESNAWGEANFRVCYLEEQHRQEDEALLEILNAIRRNTVDDSHLERLSAQLAQYEEPSNHTTTKLYTHNADVDRINSEHLSSITEEEYRFVMSFSGDPRLTQSMIKGCMAPEELVLKKGAEVMFVANNFAGRFVNGTRGMIIDFEDGRPVVQVGRRKIKAEKHSWKIEENGEVVAEITQYPLRLAWAITIHKSQGMSIDSAEIDLSRAFEPGMGYVALSRLRSLNGLKLKGLNKMALQINPKILEFDVVLRQQSSSEI